MGVPNVAEVITPIEKKQKPVQQLPPAERKIPSEPPEPPTTLQQLPGPPADDQLMDSWEKDVEKAVEEPRERRKIHFSLPAVENAQVRYFVNFFSVDKKEFFEKALVRSGRYVSAMAEILRDEGLPEDLVYLALIESGFLTDARSNAHAVGLWQFMRGTALRYGLQINWWVDERRDPLKSTRAAAAYLKDLHRQFGRWYLAAAAYNAGEGKIGRALHRSGAKDFWTLSQGADLNSETRNFVPKFIAASLIASEPEKYGFENLSLEPPLEYDEVKIKRVLRLETVAAWADTTVDVIKALNPALLRDFTPPSLDGTPLRVPVGKGEAFTQAYHRLRNVGYSGAIPHTVRKGETLWGIAKRYGQRVTQIMQMNSLKNHRIHIGQHLMIGLTETGRRQ